MMRQLHLKKIILNIIDVANSFCFYKTNTSTDISVTRDRPIKTHPFGTNKLTIIVTYSETSNDTRRATTRQISS